MNVVSLRTMTKKSVFKTDGKFANQTVGSLLKSPKGLERLVYSYFNYERISFVDEVLNELGIIPEIRLEKPSKITKEEYYEITKKYFPNFIYVTDYKIIRDGLKSEEKSASQKGILKTVGRKTKSGHLNKLYLTRKNHGH